MDQAEVIDLINYVCDAHPPEGAASMPNDELIVALTQSNALLGSVLEAIERERNHTDEAFCLRLSIRRQQELNRAAIRDVSLVQRGAMS